MQSDRFDRRMVFWALFATLSLTLPVVFYMVQLVEVMPFAAIVVLAGRAVVAWFRYPAMPSGFLVLYAIHVAVFGPLLWLLSKGVSSLVVRARDRAVRYIGAGTVVLLMVVVAYLAPYGMGGHGSQENLSWARTFMAW